jgi:excinuclease ABC subunit A
VVIIEHNLDVIRNADWLIDMGPEGGEDGGRVIAEGRPAQVAAVAGSFTGEFLARYYAEHGAPADALPEVAVAEPEADPEVASTKPKKNAVKSAAKKAASAKKPRQTKASEK